MIQIQKRGDTFQLPLVYQRLNSSGQWEPKPLTGCVFRSQVRTEAKGQLVCELTVTVNNALQGLATLLGTPAQTAAWPVQRLLCDVECVWPDGIKQSSETIYIDVEADVTRDE